MPTMRVVHVSKAKGSFKLKELDISAPGPTSARITVQAYSICHSDELEINLSPFPSSGRASFCQPEIEMT